MPILRYAYIRWWDLALEVVVVYRAIHSKIILSLHKAFFFLTFVDSWVKHNACSFDILTLVKP